MAQIKPYKAGDIITFPNQRPSHWNKKGLMDKYLGKTVTLTNVYDMNPTIGLQRLFFHGCDQWLFLSTDLNPSKVKVGDEVQLLIPFKVFRIFPSGLLDICDIGGNCLTVSEVHVKFKQTDMKQMKDAVLTVAKDLAKANNTVTTLDIKTQLRRDYPYFFWTQDVVSKFMDGLAGDGLFTYKDNGTYRIYSVVNPPLSSGPVGIPVTKSLAVPAGKGTGNTVSVSASGLKVRRTKIDASQLLNYASSPQFVSVVLADGTTVYRNTIKAQKKSPVGYITPKLGKIRSIVVGTTQYNVK